ncbi:MAG: FG-GAP-like repeat-containing protein [Bacteroidota bacterium]
MKKLCTLFLLSLVATVIAFSQAHLGAKYTPRLKMTKPDSAWMTDIGVRGAWMTNDLDQDGKPELLVTDYTKSGRVHAFQAVGNDSIEWIWSSPRLDTVAGIPFGPGSASTPRTIRTGDMDGDGIGEIIFPRGGSTGGFLIFEWDGVKGSHKFGTTPSAFIPANVAYGGNFGSLSGVANEGGLQTTVEQFEVMDVDKDGQQELITPKNLASTANDDYLIIHAVGSWEYENPGLSTFEIEGSTLRQASTRFGGGSPYSIVPADLNGDGKYELVCNNYNFGDYWVIKVTGPDTYELPVNLSDTTKMFYYQNKEKTQDLVALFGTTVADFDKDGNQEVYFPWYYAYMGAQAGYSLNVVNYSPGNNVLEADSTHSFSISEGVSLNVDGSTFSSYRASIGDLDRNGKPELLIGSFYPSMLVGIEYQSGDVTKAANYTRKVYYKGESNSFQTISYRDSLGVKDTIGVRDESFASKITNPVDFDGDGKIEVVFPMQGIWDSTTVSWSHYNKDSVRFFVDSTKKITNPKKWIFRSVESDIAGSVGSKELTLITPDDYLLNQNYPNPFNPSTTINFVLPLTKKVSIRIYDMLGKEITTLTNNEEFAKGSHTVTWNGRDLNGKAVASGAYIAKMNAGNVEKNIKMMLIK